MLPQRQLIRPAKISTLSFIKATILYFFDNNKHIFAKIMKKVMRFKANMLSRQVMGVIISSLLYMSSMLILNL